MRYERGNVVISVNQIDGMGKNPGLWIGTNDPNTVWKVASFGSADKAQTFCKWFEYMIGLRQNEPEEKPNEDAENQNSQFERT